MNRTNTDKDRTGIFWDNEANQPVSLVGFRLNAPYAVGFREKLLAYRKSLPNSWDYNAYVGILLGVGGPKHGDIACMNFAIGQGDNGSNTRKALEARGLMPVFEKYKGKKIDASVMLSDVEDEIVSIVPEYEQIRQNLKLICQGGEEIKPVMQTVKKEIQVTDIPKSEDTVPRHTMGRTYEDMPSHEVSYSFPIIFEMSGEIHRVWRNREYYNMVQEYKGDLYYANYDTENWTITCCRCNVNQTGKIERLAEFSSDKFWAANGKVYKGTDVCRAGAGHRTFCVYKGRIYYSECQMRAECERSIVKDNAIWSMDLNGNDRRIELEWSGNPPLFCPYVTDKAFVFDEGYWIDRKTKIKKYIKKGGNIHYLAINEETVSAIDKDYNVFVYDFETEKRTPIEKVYKGAKEKDIIYIDAEKDILYYLENGKLNYEKKCFTDCIKKDVSGKIVGIAKDGSIVDVWEHVQGYSDHCMEYNGVIHFSECDGSERDYSAVLFNGRKRIYKASNECLGENVRGDSIFSVGRDGSPRQIYKKEWNGKLGWEEGDKRSMCSVVHMLTPNYFISHITECGDMATLLFNQKEALEKAFPLNGNSGYISLY